jgi:putative hydroxymethylpyrimidine transport system substrate-binding protein
VRRIALTLAAAALLGGCGGGDDQAGQPREAVLALDFAPNAVHAGIYAAVAGGHDRAAGVRLRVRAPTASTDSLRLLASRRANLAIVDIHDLGLARERGEDVVAVGALVQRPLAAVIARGEVERPRDLEGRRAGVTGLPSDEAVLRAVVQGDGGDYGRVDRVTIGFTAVPSLISEKVDAATAFWNAEGVALREEGVDTREFRVDDFGAPAYPELVLVVRRETLERDRELVAGAVEALTRGTEDALRDPAEAVRRVTEASKAEESLVRAQFEAVRPALSPPLVLDREALEGWARFDERFGILETRPAVDEAFDFSFQRR